MSELGRQGMNESQPWSDLMGLSHKDRNEMSFNLERIRVQNLTSEDNMWVNPVHYMNLVNHIKRLEKQIWDIAELPT